MASSVIKKGLPFTYRELAVGETVSLGNQITLLLWYGWSGLKATTHYYPDIQDSDGNKYYFPKSGTYRITIRNNVCKGKKPESNSVTDIHTKVSSIAFYPGSCYVEFNFTEAPLSSAECFILVCMDASIIRTA